MDIGQLHHSYRSIGALGEGFTGMEWPAELKGSSSIRAEGFWLGVKDWTDTDSVFYPYYVTRVGPKFTDSSSVTAVSSRLVSKWHRPEVTVNGIPFETKSNYNDEYEVDPMLPADHMIHHVFRTKQGVEVDLKVYAFVSDDHDDYHIIDRTFTNTGNVDLDNEIELPGQTVNELMIFNIWRWRGREEAGWASSSGQVWGKFNMVDIVGDGNEEYPVDFTAVYSWAGKDPNYVPGWDPFGGPYLDQRNDYYLETTGRLTGMSMQGLVVLHADTSPMDKTYDPIVQPRTLGWMDMGEPLTGEDESHMEYYERGILTRENPNLVPGGSTRMYPHYANRVDPSGEFWNSRFDASSGKQEGHGATVGYGPYQLGPGEQVRIVEALVSNGLSVEAADSIGRAYVASGFDDEALIEFDANKDGEIDTTPFDYSVHDNGAEALTKNQWYMTARDSMFTSMQRARDSWAVSEQMQTYPVEAPSPPPLSFQITTFEERIELTWEPQDGGTAVDSWEVYRTTEDYKNLYYERIASLNSSERSYIDLDVEPDSEYYYYVQAVSDLQQSNSGLLRSSKFLTQSKIKAVLFENSGVPEFMEIIESERELDLFGGDISNSGDYLAVAASGDDEQGEDNGAVYVYERQQDGTWIEGARIIIPTPLIDGAPEQERLFGDRVHVDGKTLFIRDQLDDETEQNAGAIYVYERNEDGEWESKDKLTVPLDVYQEDYRLGAHMATQGNLLLTNNRARLAFPNRYQLSRSVYVFEKQNDDSWLYKERLPEPENESTTAFGKTLMLNLPFAFIGVTEGIGDAVLVYELLDDGTWVERQRLPLEFPSGDAIPQVSSLAVSEDQVLISAFGLRFEVEEDYLRGWVLVYEYNSADGTWNQKQLFRAEREEENDVSDLVGPLVASGNRLMASAGNRAIIYARQPDGTWAFVDNLRPPGVYESEFRGFGQDIALDGDLAFASTTEAGLIANSAVYAYDLSRITSTSVEDPNNSDSEIPTSFSLSQNYPNPFNPSTTIPFSVPRPANVKLIVYDVLGRVVETLVDKQFHAGQHEISFNASSYPSGTYIYRIEAGDFTSVQKMVLIK